MPNSRSIRNQILLPMICGAIIVSVVVAWISWRVARFQALDEMRSRYQRIKSIVQGSSFPFTPAVVDSLSQLTAANWVAAAPDGKVLHSSLPKGLFIDSESILQLSDKFDESGGHKTIELGTASSGSNERTQKRHYYAFVFQRPSNRAGQSVHVAVLFDRQQVESTAFKSAQFPLLTGLSTVVLITALMLVTSSRLVNRIRRLELQVGRVAQGDFQSDLPVEQNDEIGRLSQAFNSMSAELRRLWDQVNRQQGAKLLHQISGSMAHQLRNTLTGARMAIELHQSRGGERDTDEVQVALGQIETAEDYVNRLTEVGMGIQQETRPMPLHQCLANVRSTHQPIAEHLNVQYHWEETEIDEHLIIADGPAFIAAVSNLVLNAMQAGDQLWISTKLHASSCCVTVKDNGSGIDPDIAENLFDPFVTTKPEGMGLGLTLVHRTAEKLNGSIHCDRLQDLTVFRFCVAYEPDVTTA